MQLVVVLNKNRKHVYISDYIVILYFLPNLRKQCYRNNANNAYERAWSITVL